MKKYILSKKIEKFLSNSHIDVFSSENLNVKSNLVIFSGSFNPVTFGHLEIANEVENILKNEIIFEISINRFDKEPYSQQDIIRLNNQFINLGRICIFTKKSSFISKLLLFGINTSFIIGGDTLYRILDKKYYHNCELEKERIIKILGNAKWFVAPRGEFTQNHEMFKDCPLMVHWLNTKIDISSTEIRNKK